MVKPASGPATAESNAPVSFDPWQHLSIDAAGGEAARRRIPFVAAAGCILLALILLTGIRQPLRALDPLQRALTPQCEERSR